MSDLTVLMYVVLAASVLALSFAYYFYRSMLGKEEGTELMKKIVNDAAEKVDPDKVTKVKENMLKEAEISFKNNNFWMSAIVDWKLYGKDNYTDYKKLIENVKPEDISSYIKNVILKSGNHAEVIMRPE